MRLTNRHDIPVEFIRFNDATAHDRGESDISVSSLIDSPQVVRLIDEWDHRLETDAAEDILRILGTAVHNVLEMGSEGLEGVICERRFFVTVADKVLSGQLDKLELKDNGKYKLTDYKVTSGATLVFNPKGKREWELQTNVYRWLGLKNGFDIDEIEVVAVIRDWSAAQARRDDRFPQVAVKRVPIWVWDEADAQSYVERRMDLHFNTELVECSKEERWEKDPVWAVHEYLASGSGLKKRANRLFKSEMEADDYVARMGIKAKVIERPGKAVRCEDNWCGVAEFCPQYRVARGDNE